MPSPIPNKQKAIQTMLERQFRLPFAQKRDASTPGYVCFAVPIMNHARYVALS